MTIKACQFRFYPNKTQQQKLKKFFGAKRFVWNTCLSWRSSIYEAEKQSVSGVDFNRELTWLKQNPNYGWLKDTPLPTVGKTVGIDLGVLSTLTLSDGAVIANPRHLIKRKDQLKKLQQRLSRQEKTSNRRAKTKLRIAKLHARIADARADHLHQITSRIVNENQVIVLENLNVKGMTASSKGSTENPGKMVKQKAGLNRAILDVSFGEINRLLEYKAKWYGRTLLKVDRFFPSSKLCSGCGHKADEMRLDVRVWTCPKCNAVHDRDINAAINIQNEGLKQLAPAGTLGEVRDAGSEGVYSMAVSPRNSDQPNASLELG